MEQKRSKLAVFSFVMSLIALLPVVLIILDYLLTFLRFIPGVKYVDSFLVLINISIAILCFSTGIIVLFPSISLITSIISLRLIKKYNLKGKKLAWISLIISVILVLLYMYLWQTFNLDLRGIFS